MVGDIDYNAKPCQVERERDVCKAYGPEKKQGVRSILPHLGLGVPHR